MKPTKQHSLENSSTLLSADSKTVDLSLLRLTLTRSLQPPLNQRPEKTKLTSITGPNKEIKLHPTTKDIQHHPSLRPVTQMELNQRPEKT